MAELVKCTFILKSLAFKNLSFFFFSTLSRLMCLKHLCFYTFCLPEILPGQDNCFASHSVHWHFRVILNTRVSHSLRSRCTTASLFAFLRRPGFHVEAQIALVVFSMLLISPFGVCVCVCVLARIKSPCFHHWPALS